MSTRTNSQDLAKILIGEVIRGIIGASTYDPKIGKVETILSETIGSERLKSFQRSLVDSRRRSDATSAWNTFVKSLECVKSERTQSQRSLKLKLTAGRKKAIQESMKTNILEGLSIHDYRMAILREALKTALDHEASGNFDHRGLGGNTVLHFLAALPVDSKERRAFTLEAIELLVEKYNIDCKIKNDKSLTALHIIIGNYVLDPRTNFEPSPSRSLVPSTLPSIEGRYKVLCCFNMADSFDVRGPNGNSILHEWVIQRAITCKHEENDKQNKEEERIGQWIISNANVSPNKTNDYGCTPLHYAFSTHLVTFLCKNGAEKNRHSESGETPFMYILKHCFFPGFVCNVLPPEHDLETTLSSCIGIRKSNDVNLEKIAKYHSMALETLKKFLKNLSDAGFDLNEKDGPLNGDKDCLDYLLCILRECVCKGCSEEDSQRYKTIKCILECVEMLVQKSAVLNGEQKGGRRSPLYQMFLLYFDSHDMLHDKIRTQIRHCVEQMLEAHADPDTPDNNGDTALHFCCEKVDPSKKQQKKLVTLLCEFDASRTKKNDKGHTPIQILENRKNQQCTKLAKHIATLKSRLWVEVDLKSERYKDGLDKLCRTKSPAHKVGAFRYDPSHIGKGAMSFIFLAVDEKSKREVALKRIIKASFEKELMNEIKSLVKLEQNLNVVKYYTSLEDDPIFYYLALELMEGDLSYLVREHKSLELSLDEEATVRLSSDVVNGLSFLHQQCILHRDLKPGNILFRIDTNRQLCLKLADFGLAKHLTVSVNQSTLLSGSTSSSLTGTRGWIAPELVRRDVQEHSKSTDMFALGLVLHFLISKGFHPFDNSGTPLSDAVSSGTLKPHELETGIVNGKPEHLWKDLTTEARHLMELLLSDVPSQRPAAEGLLKQNCYFWSKLKKVEFMNAVGGQKEIAKPCMLYLVCLELEHSAFGDHVRINPWNIDVPDLSNEMFSRRSYDTQKVIDLIRFFRNAYAHFQERSQTCKLQLLNDIFFAKFPNFFFTVWKVMRDMGWLKKNSGRDWLLRVANN